MNKIFSTIQLFAFEKILAAEKLIFLGHKFNKTPSKLELLDFVGFLLYLGKNIIGIASFIAIIYIMIGGVTMVMSSGNADQVQKGKNTLTYAILGFIVAMAAYLIVDTFITYITGVSISSIPESPANIDNLNPAIIPSE